MGLFKKKQQEPTVVEWAVRGFLTSGMTDEERALSDQLYSHLVAGAGGSSKGRDNVAQLGVAMQRTDEARTKRGVGDGRWAFLGLFLVTCDKMLGDKSSGVRTTNSTDPGEFREMTDAIERKLITELDRELGAGGSGARA